MKIEKEISRLKRIKQEVDALTRLYFECKDNIVFLEDFEYARLVQDKKTKKDTFYYIVEKEVLEYLKENIETELKKGLVPVMIREN